MFAPGRNLVRSSGAHQPELMIRDAEYGAAHAADRSRQPLIASPLLSIPYGHTVWTPLPAVQCMSTKA
jgi:hypothetical protein